MLDEKDLGNFAASASKMVDLSGELIRTDQQNSFVIDIKDDGSPVTSIDKAAEMSIRSTINQLYPDHGIDGEEYGPSAADSEFVWVIDPIDGTLPFVAGLPVFGTLLALLHNGVPVLGVIDMPMTRERWIGGTCLPTTHNGKAVRTRSCKNLASAVMSTSNPDFYDETSIPILKRMQQASMLNVYGGSCMAYGQIASGRIDVGIDVQFDIHDYLPLVPVISGAGGIISDWYGNPLDMNSGDRFIAAGDQRTHAEALNVLNQN
jgi:inositol-phosphate phosphatase/L-galactose 1-phosphate phosphatase/histidinol-phosphatase